MLVHPAAPRTFQSKVDTLSPFLLIQHVTLVVLSTLALTSFVCCVGAFTGVIDSDVVKWVSFTTCIVSSVSIYLLSQKNCALPDNARVQAPPPKENVAAKSNALSRLPKPSFATLPLAQMLLVNEYSLFPDMNAALICCKQTRALRDQHVWTVWAKSLGCGLNAPHTQLHAAHYVKAFFGSDRASSDYSHWSEALPKRLHVYKQPKGIGGVFSAFFAPSFSRIRTALNIKHLRDNELFPFFQGEFVDFNSNSRGRVSDPYVFKYLLTHYTKATASLDIVLDRIAHCHFVFTPYFFSLLSMDDLRTKVTRNNQTLLQLSMAPRKFQNGVLLIHASVLKNFDFGRGFIDEVKQTPAHFTEILMSFFKTFDFLGYIGERISYGRSCGSYGFACALNQNEIALLLTAMMQGVQGRGYSIRNTVLVLNLLLTLTRLLLPQNHLHYPPDNYPKHLPEEERQLPPERLRQTQIYICSYLENNHPHFLEELSAEWEKQPELKDKQDLLVLLRADYIRGVAG